MDPLPVIDKPTTDPDLDFESTEEQHLRFESMAPNITQWLTRSLSVDGEIIEGGVRIEFDEGQRDATVHVSFCPPFHRVPEVTTEDLDAAGLEIRVAAIFPFGSRLSVRRAQGPKNREQGLQKEACRIGFVAIVAAAKRAA